MLKFPRAILAALGLAGFVGAFPAMAGSGWEGAGWYEVAMLGIIVGPYNSEAECRAVEAPDEQAHPDYGYDCVYLGQDPG